MTSTFWRTFCSPRQPMAIPKKDDQDDLPTVEPRMRPRTSSPSHPRTRTLILHFSVLIKPHHTALQCPRLPSLAWMPIINQGRALRTLGLPHVEFTACLTTKVPCGFLYKSLGRKVLAVESQNKLCKRT